MNKALAKKVKQTGKSPQNGVSLSQSSASVTFKLKESHIGNILQTSHI